MPDTETLNPVFLENMRILWRQDPKLAQRLDELPLDASLDVKPSKKGPVTAVVTTPDGRSLYLHSRYDPLREAKDFCLSLDSSEASCIILHGLGLGYHVKALHETLGDEIVIFVSEPDLVTLKTALEHTNLTKELRTGRLEFLTTLEKGILHERLGRHSTVLMLGTQFVAPPVARDHHADEHAACRQVIMDYASFAKLSLVTLVKNSEITCRNIAHNLPTYVSTPPADTVRRRFQGYPAILVAAGPSLARNIEQLRSLQDKAVIIAAQTTLRPLLAHGITPHFVTSLDYSDLSRQFFEGIDIPDDLVLVAEPKASWHVIDAFKGTEMPNGRRVILLDNAFARRCVGDELGKRTPIEAGATVMHLAFYLAQWLGCDPIILIGQDLGFTDHCYYAPGVAMHQAWQPELGRFVSLEMKEWERIVRQRQILRKVKDIKGRDLYTDDQMFTYLEQFERDFARGSSTVIDATEGGAKLRGTTVMTLREATAKHCRQRIPPETFDYLKGTWYDKSRLSKAEAVVKSRREELDQFRSLCEKTRDILSKLAGLANVPDKFNQLIVRVDELRTLVQKHDVVFNMVRDVSQLGELQKFAEDRKIAGEGFKFKGTSKAERQVQRDKRFIESMLDGCDRLESVLDGTLSRFATAAEAQS